MRIDPNLAIQPTALDTPKSQASSPKPATGPSGPASVVALSPAATAAAGPQQPSVTARIERIRSLLERGAYPIDLDVLASRIVDDDALRAGRPS
ncbi:MAG: flagellar biosynthesis anti-sigma factor FlgM [Deltaproteobacteria bacterium]|nr:flagellar biosynthesis anti-sigma factor FlgM [Deltaproteobacteria bacterium]MCW5804107.1 flagellar biosynthesis anti-sigma factor FlgM [Deltaproteobacteria bacterium]